MAHHNPYVVQDPALVKYEKLWVDRYKYFRWTRRTAGISFAYAIAFPAFLGYWAYVTDGKWVMRGKRRGDTISEF